MRHSHILFVEDDEDDVFLLKRVCKKLGIEGISFAANGRRAVEYLSGGGGQTDAAKPIIFLDLNMPEMDGFEFLKWLRGQSAMAPIPVILLSTSESPQDIARAYSLGANAYLVKSSNIEDLTRMLGSAHTFWLQYNRLPNG